MSKITLLEARDITDKINIKDVFASYISDSIAVDSLKLITYKSLIHKIWDAERYFGIDLIRHQIVLLNYEEKYYKPCNSVFYYKEAISESFKDENREQWLDISNSIKQLKDKITAISEHIYIEVD